MPYEPPPLTCHQLARSAEMLAVPERICRRRDCRRRHRCHWFFRATQQPCCLANLDAEQRRLLDELARIVADAEHFGYLASKIRMSSSYRETRALQDAGVEAARALVAGRKRKAFRAFEKMRAAQPAPKYEGAEPPLPKHW